MRISGDFFAYGIFIQVFMVFRMNHAEYLFKNWIQKETGFLINEIVAFNLIYRYENVSAYINNNFVNKREKQSIE